MVLRRLQEGTFYHLVAKVTQVLGASPRHQGRIMHREALPEPVCRLLLGLSGLKSKDSVYLGGGTALALQLGHCISADLDFFVPRNADYQTLINDIRDLGMTATIISLTPSHCELIIEAIKVDYLR
jgi:hypothetical protein